MLDSEMPNAIDVIVWGTQELIDYLRAQEMDVSLPQQEREPLQRRIETLTQKINRLRAKPAEVAADSSPQPVTRGEGMQRWTNDPKQDPTRPFHGIVIIG